MRTNGEIGNADPRDWELSDGLRPEPTILDEMALNAAARKVQEMADGQPLPELIRLLDSLIY